VHPGADLTGRDRAAGSLDDGQGVERGMGQTVAARDLGNERVDLAADDLELSQRPAGEPRGSWVLPLERVGLGRTRRGGTRLAGTTARAST
jgi:hypothetical protein